MISQQLIEETQLFVKMKLESAESGHDWWHAHRVWKLSINIAKEEILTDEKQLLVIQLAALLHDIADAKFHNGNEDLGVQVAKLFLQNKGVSVDVMEQVLIVIYNISYKGGQKQNLVRSKALDIVQDADRLDALGAIGIARTFSYGGYKCRPLYDPAIPPMTTMTKEEYRNSKAPTINHFYEKLFKLKDLMNTLSGKTMAIKRHQFMEAFVSEFYSEWGN